MPALRRESLSLSPEVARTLAFSRRALLGRRENPSHPYRPCYPFPYLIKKIPLRKLNACWTEGSTLRTPLGVEFDCPVCLRFPHRFRLGMHDQRRWDHPLYRYSGETIFELSLFPTIVGERHYPACTFRGWVKLGQLEMQDLAIRPVRRWENVDFDLFLGKDLRHGQLPEDD